MATHPVTPARIMEVGMGFFAAKTLLSAVELGLFGALAGGPLDAGSLGARIGLHPRGAFDFLDALAALGFLERQGDGPDARYANTPETDTFLVPGKPTFIGGILNLAGSRTYRLWADLPEGLRTGEPQNGLNESGAADPFAAVYADPQALEAFVDAMTGFQIANFELLAERFDFGRYAVVCDVGGAGADLSMVIARRYDGPHCISLDLPPVTSLARRRVETAGLTDRVDAIEGDFLRDPLPAADVIVMGNVLHDWGIETKKMLIRKAAAALPAGGAFIAIENIIDDARRENAQGMLMSLNMLMETKEGGDYTFAQFAEWCAEAGFARMDRIALTGSASAAIAYR